MPNFSGKWNLDGQLRGIKQGTWTGIALPELYVWGSGDNGQVGDDTRTNRSSPVQIGTEDNWSQVSVGSDKHSIAITTGNKLYTWGNNGTGKLGQGDYVFRSSPTQVGALTNWSQASANSAQSLAVKTDGTLWGWGDNGSGRLGINNTSRQVSPVQIGSLTTWSQVSTASGHTAAVTTDGELYVWGSNTSGQLGQNNTTNTSSPVQVGALTNWSQVSAGSAHTGAIKTDGTLWMWGNGGGGRLGNNISQTIDVSSPVQIGSLTNWSQISTSGSGDHTIAVTTDGEIYAWGNNTSGQLGLNDIIRRSSPVQIGALTNWSQVAAGSSHTITSKTDGTLWAWGNNGFGRLGTNTDQAVDVSSPVQVGALTTWSQVSAGYVHSAAINEARTGMS